MWNPELRRPCEEALPPQWGKGLGWGCGPTLDGNPRERRPERVRLRDEDRLLSRHPREIARIHPHPCPSPIEGEGFAQLRPPERRLERR